MEKKSKYAECDHIPKPVVESDATQEILKEIGTVFRTLPTYEQSLFDIARRKYYSLNTNEYLNCRWNVYKNGLRDKIKAPYQFVNVRDFHFYKNCTCLKPSESVYRRTNFKKCLKPGPGVDHLGPVPIPDDMMINKTVSIKRPKSKPKNEKKKFDNKK